jgi:dipeptidyl aminopeptidase/acylaminoacyl peptidase
MGRLAIPGVAAGIFLVAASLARAGGSGGVPFDFDLGDISTRPPAPEYAFERFVRTRELKQLQISPDNRTVFYLDNDGRVDNVFAMALANGEVRQITYLEEPVSGFLVDHGGRFLVVVQDVGGNENYDLYRFDLQTGRRTRLTNAGRGDTTMLCGLSPDDSRIYYAQTRDNRREAGLWQVDRDGGNVRLLLPGRGSTLECDAVSPDGRYLVFGELIGFDTRHLGLLDLASGEKTTILAVDGVNNLDGGFAGEQVYFRSAMDADGFRIWRYRIGDRRPPAPVELPFATDIEGLQMHAQGRVAVVDYRDRLTGRTAVFVDGFESPESFGLEREFVVGAVFSRDDPRLGIVFTERAAQPRRYYRVGGGEPVLLYDANRSGIEPSQLAEARSLFVPVRDGLEIPVHLFIPNGTSAQKPRPAIVLVHGGPEEHVDPRYLSTVQFIANHGFIVVVPNVRGSTGFGKRYASLDDGDWGGAHIRDIVDVAETVRQLDFIETGNLFVMGASFGGFSVMSLITRYPDSFNAAVNFFGFTELATFVDSWPRYLQRHLQSALGFDPRRDRYRNWLLSPIYHWDRIRIPLQIHQGANDSRVPREQSDWLVQRLRRLGQPVEYFVYADEGHGFTRLENESAAYERMIGFIRRYLK